MCGIIAIAGYKISPESFDEALSRLRHRGPDASGHWKNETGDVQLGHRRLAIVDLSSAGNQPLASEDGSLRMVCNGEIYNAPQLRRSLQGFGHRFSSRSDNEVILHAFEEWGPQCLNRLEGMYAFVLYDLSSNVMFAARDRIGIKPLYLAPVKGGLVIASELKGLLPLLPDRPEPDPLALAYLLSLGYIPSPRSVWKGVEKLPPGHLLRWRANDGTTVERYWAPPESVSDGDSDIAEWEDLFGGILQDHVQSDVPVGIFLSGGMDSSAVAAGLAEQNCRPPALTVSFPGSAFDESVIAEEVCNHLGLKSNRIPLRMPDVTTLLDEAVTIYDEPQGFSALLSMARVCSAADRFKVVLSGDGGDEVFAGYSWYRPETGRKARLAKYQRRWLSGRVGDGASPPATARAMRCFADTSLLHRHAMRLFPRFLPEEAAALLRPLGVDFDDQVMLEPLRKHFVEDLPWPRALQRVDLMTFCPDSILAKVDRASMHHSLEVRVPFLDRRIVEYGLLLNPLRQKSSYGKPLLKDYLQSRVPKSVLDHPKQGFSLRIMDTFDWNSALDSIADCNWVGKGGLASDWRKFVVPGMPYREGRIWTLLVLSKWIDKWSGGMQ